MHAITTEERRPATAEALQLLATVDDLSRDVREGQRRELGLWGSGPASPDSSPAHASRSNLAAFLALRRHDVRRLEERLERLGLASLDGSESHVRSSLASSAAVLAALSGVPGAGRRVERLARLVDAQSALLEERTIALLGPAPPDRRTRIMATLPGAAASDADFVVNLVRRGMDLARINAAHDDPDTWRRLARRVREASVGTGRPCGVLIDLPGPKLRIGPFEPKKQPTVQLRARGGRIGPVRFLLDGSGAPGDAGLPDHAPDVPEAWARVPVDPVWLEALRAGDELELRDARGKPRRLLVEGRVTPTWLAVSAERRIDLGPGLSVWLRRRPERVTTIGSFAPVPIEVRVRAGDRILLARDTTVGRAPRTDGAGNTMTPPTIACLQPEILDDLRTGDPVLIDDGHIHTRVDRSSRDGLLLVVERTRNPTERIRPDQGLTLPRTRFRKPGLTDLDRRALDVAVDVADLVAISFVRTPRDVDHVRAALDESSRHRIGLVAKIETRQGVDALPAILAAGVGDRPFGVMIARGDLAKEVGYERLTELQEELLRLCEAAHVPVIWAAQVLESLVKTGIPSRAEVTEAALSERTECVMLNRGPFINDALTTLVDILRRTEAHRQRRAPRLRPLRSW